MWFNTFWNPFLWKLMAISFSFIFIDDLTVFRDKTLFSNKLHVLKVLAYDRFNRFHTYLSWCWLFIELLPECLEMDYIGSKISISFVDLQHILQLKNPLNQRVRRNVSKTFHYVTNIHHSYHSQYIFTNDTFTHSTSLCQPTLSFYRSHWKLLNYRVCPNTRLKLFGASKITIVCK